MLLIGLTGGIGAGKSAVSRFFRDNGIPVIDADELAKYVVEPGRREYQMLREEFGCEYFDDLKDGARLKRKKLGELVFRDSEKRKRLNEIIHPAVRREIIWRVFIKAISLHKIIVLDVPLLFEVGMNRLVHQTILVTCDERTQLKRVQARDGLVEPEVLARIAAQMPNEEKVKLATHVIDNNGSIDSTKQQTEAIIARLRMSWVPFILRSSIVFSFSAILYWIIRRFINFTY